jgi:hypothetical protein
MTAEERVQQRQAELKSLRATFTALEREIGTPYYGTALRRFYEITKKSLELADTSCRELGLFLTLPDVTGAKRTGG